MTLRREWRVAAWIIVGFFVVAIAIGWVSDGVTRYRAESGTDGTVGTLVFRQIVEENVGKPPPIESWAGTFRSDDGTVVRVRLAEELPGGDEDGAPGDIRRVRWLGHSPDVVYLEEDSRAFRNWVEGTVFLGVSVAAIGGVALAVRRRRPRKLPETQP